jgi:Ca-activated chloride channel family protein
MSWATLAWREPLWLLLALALPALLWLRQLLVRWSGAYADPALLPWVRVERVRRPWRRLFSRNSAYLTAWLLLAVALAGPRHPLSVSGDALPTGRTLLAVVDLSRSMAAADVLPDRRRRAALELHELLEHARGSRLGLVVFAGRAHQYVPPTADAAALRFYLATLDRLVLPTHGSAAAQALELAARTLAGESSPAVVLLSDGDLDDGGGELERAARDLAAAGIGLYVLGIGSPEGEAIPLPEGGWLEHEGQPVISRLDEERLQALAAAGHGGYQRMAADDSDWTALYDRGIAPAAAATAEEAAAGRTQWREHYPWVLLPALLLLFLSVMPYRIARSPGAAVLLCCGWLALQAPGEALADETAALRQAGQAWQAGDFAEALSYYAVIPGYIGGMGAGAGHYRMEDFAGAAVHFSRAVLAAANDSERADALYNLGNSLFRQGDYAGAVRVFGDVLLYCTDDKQARHNLALSAALQQAVQARLDEDGTAGRAGRGPRSARAAEGLDVGSSSSLSLDDSEEQPVMPLPPLPGDAEALIARGLEHITLASGASDRVATPTWQQDLAQARLHMQGLQEAPERVWKRLFEIEEGFPAPLEQPRNRPGVRPW